MSLKLKIMYHAILANYHSHMVASIFNKHDTAGTKLYLKHWSLCVKHKDKAEHLRVRLILNKFRDGEDIS